MRLEEVLRRHLIPTCWRRAFTELFYIGEIANAEFRMRLNVCRNFRECVAELRRLAGREVYRFDEPTRYPPAAAVAEEPGPIILEFRRAD